jgi:2-polyprenyl-3-methyl-5-hydroxy-6-metoxy-1,4-benzoquinol methylase
MAQEDKQRWDKKHSKNMMPQEPIKLIKEYAHLVTGKDALDIACGNGRHSRYLVSLGFKVDALDISSVAIKQLQGIENIDAKEVDFDTYTLDKQKYDLITVTYFLERRLFSQMIEALKPNGILIMETFIHHEKNERTPSNPAFRLNEGELKDYFAEKLEIIYLDEWWDKDYQGYQTMKASMVARKI